MGNRISNKGNESLALHLLPAGINPGVQNLTTTITLNNETVAPECFYRAGDATAASPSYIQPYQGYGVPLTGNYAVWRDNSVPFVGLPNMASWADSSSGFVDNTLSVGNLGTDDFVIELIDRHHDTFSNLFECTRRSGSDSGWTFTHNPGGGNVFFRMTDLTASLVTPTLQVGEGTWNHILLFVDRDDQSAVSGSAIIVNGNLYYTKDRVKTFTAYTVAGAISSSQPFRAGGQAGWLSFGLWKKPNWFTSGPNKLEEWKQFAKNRFLQLLDLKNNSNNSKLEWYVSALQPTGGRDLNGLVDIYDEYFHSSSVRYSQVGPGWPPMARKKLADGSVVWGLLTNKNHQNLFLESQCFDVSADTLKWRAISGTHGSHNVEGPLDWTRVYPNSVNKSGHPYIANSTSTQHYISQSVSLTANTRYCVSIMAKSGACDYLYIKNQSLSNAIAYFDLKNQFTATYSSQISASWMWDMGNGWNRCGMVFAAASGFNEFRFGTTNADNTEEFAGNGTDISVVWDGAHLDSRPNMGPYIGTPHNTQSTRHASKITVLVSSGAFNYGGYSKPQGAIHYKIKNYRWNTGSIQSMAFWDNYENHITISSGTAGTVNEIAIQSSYNNQAFEFATLCKSGTTASEQYAENTLYGSTIARSASHDIRFAWDIDFGALYVDGKLRGNVCTNFSTSSPFMPTIFTRLNIGGRCDFQQDYCADSFIYDIKLFKKPVI